MNEFTHIMYVSTVRAIAVACEQFQYNSEIEKKKK